MSINKIYLHDIRMDAFLKYFNNHTVDLTQLEKDESPIETNVYKYGDIKLVLQKEKYTESQISYLTNKAGIPNSITPEVIKSNIYEVVNLTNSVLDLPLYSCYKYYEITLDQEKNESVNLKIETDPSMSKDYELVTDVKDSYFSFYTNTYKSKVNGITTYIIENILVENNLEINEENGKQNLKFKYKLPSGEIYFTDFNQDVKSKIEVYADKIRENFYNNTNEESMINYYIPNNFPNEVDCLIKIGDEEENVIKRHLSATFYRYSDLNESSTEFNEIKNDIPYLEYKTEVVFDSSNKAQYINIRRDYTVEIIAKLLDEREFQRLNVYEYDEYDDLNIPNALDNDYATKIYDLDGRYSKIKDSIKCKINKYRLCFSINESKFPVYSDLKTTTFGIFKNDIFCPVYNKNGYWLYPLIAGDGGLKIADILDTYESLDYPDLKVDIEEASFIIFKFIINNKTYQAYLDRNENKYFLVVNLSYMEDAARYSNPYYGRVYFDSELRIEKLDLEYTPISRPNTNIISDVSVIEELKTVFGSDNFKAYCNKNDTEYYIDILTNKIIKKETINCVSFTESNNLLFNDNSQTSEGNLIIPESLTENIEKKYNDKGRFLNLQNTSSNTRGDYVSNKSLQQEITNYAVNNIWNILNSNKNTNIVSSIYSSNYLKQMYYYISAMYKYYTEEKRFDSGYSGVLFNKNNYNSVDFKYRANTEPNKIYMYKRENPIASITGEISIGGKNYHYNTANSTLTTVEQNLIDTILNKTTPYTRLLEYEKYATINEKRKALEKEFLEMKKLGETKEDTLVTVKDDSISNINYIYKKETVNKDFQNVLSDFLTEFFYNDIYIYNEEFTSPDLSESFYLDSFNKFYSPKIKSEFIDYDNNIDDTEEKDAVLEFVTTSDEFNAYFNDVMDKYTKGMRF